MEKVLDNFKLLYIDIIKRVSSYLEDAHNSDLKFHKSNKKELSIIKMINQIKKITIEELDKFDSQSNLNFVLLPNNYDFHYFAKLLLINVINKNNVVFVKKNKKDLFLLQMLIQISNSFACEFNTKVKPLFLNSNILKGKQYDVKIKQLKTKQTIFLVKSQKNIDFK